MKIIDGKKIAAQVKEELKEEIGLLKEQRIIPGLTVVICGNDPASQVYVRSKKKTAEELGMNSWIFELSEDTSEKELLALIDKLNKDDKVNGILVQLPLPKHINEGNIVRAIDPQKDVDCFHPENVGNLMTGNAKFLPCTPKGIIELLRRNGIEISGKECVVVGRSNIVGKPLALMLLAENGTVTMAHSKTRDIEKVCLRADILISAVGKPGFITADMIKPGAVVIDVGINRLSGGKIVGDVDFEQAKEKVSAITPVPGGVGPMTIAMLMKNTVLSTKLSVKNKI